MGIIKKLLRKMDFWPLLLVGIAVILCIFNYTPKTWLIGWDTLHPEFNLPLNISREFFGVWRQEQGLGAMAGHSHMADLPRVLFLYFASFIFPANFLRYFYFFLCLILGPLGTYFFLNKFLLKDKEKLSKELLSFLGGLFYLLNLGTMQHFYVPFEMFATLYAFLPWLLLSAVLFMQEGKKKYLIYFLLLTIFALPMAYAATLWYVYFVFFIMFLVGFCFLGKQGKQSWKRAPLLVLLSLTINSFWLLPNIYFLLTSAKDVSLAKMNQLFSPKAFAYDSKFATLGNTALLKGFLFDWLKYKNGGFFYLLGSWIDYLKKSSVFGVGILLSLSVFWGAISSIFLDKKRRGLLILPGFIFSVLFLIHETPVLKEIFSALRDNFDIFKEGLRFPWTKFSIPVIFSFAIFFSLGIEWLFEHLLKRKLSRLILSFVLAALLIFWMKPAFQGQMISPDLRIKIPDEYLQTYFWFNTQPKNERIALLPAPTFFGWEYYRWKFEGAGFWWFGLSQPMLLRDSDRWSPQNENFYWEISQAIYSKNTAAFGAVLEKYQVNQLLVDENMINPSWPQAIFTDEIEKLLSSPKFSLVKTFGNIKVYQVNLKTPVKGFVFLESNLSSVNSYQWGNKDIAYSELGNYLSVSGASETETYYYPFRSLFSGREANNFDFEIKDLGDKFVFSKTLPEALNSYSLVIPPYNGKDLVQVNENDLSKVKYLIPITRIVGNKVEVIIPKVWGLYSANIDSTKVTLTPKNCNNFTQGKIVSEILTESNQKYLQLSAINANNCTAVFNLNNLPGKYAYLFSVEAKNISGQSLLFWLENLTNRKADLELYLPKTGSNFYLIQPPMAFDGLGYSLHFDNISIGKEKTVNELGKITVNPVPYDFLMRIKLVQSTENIAQRNGEKLNVESVNHPNPSVYEIKISGEISENTTLVLSQAFHQGWKAYILTQDLKLNTQNLKTFLAPIFGTEIKEHVLVNNWENGWILPNNFSGKLVIIFLPQYLEYLGFGLLGITLISLIFFGKKIKVKVK